MNIKRCIVLCIAMALCIVLPLWAQSPGKTHEEKNDIFEAFGDNYIIGPGDVLDISLWRDDALTKQVVVLSDGRISFPLVGEVTAGGKTIAGLKKEISDRLTEYVPEPVLSIEVKQANSLVIYVTGRVNNPGRHALNSKVTVLQALSIAGGLNPFAKRSRIKVFRQEGDKTKMFPFDYDEVVDGENIGQNITLNRGDVVVVP